MCRYLMWMQSSIHQTSPASKPRQVGCSLWGLPYLGTTVILHMKTYPSQTTAIGAMSTPDSEVTSPAASHCIIASYKLIHVNCFDFCAHTTLDFVMTCIMTRACKRCSVWKLCNFRALTVLLHGLVIWQTHSRSAMHAMHIL
jgi:hypothetical protein